AAACLPDSDITLKATGVNSGRTLVIDVLREMGARIDLIDEREIAGEPVADIRVRYNGRLKGATIEGDQIARGIDEIPVLALGGCLCDGTFIVRGAEELKVKESDRLKAITDNLRAAGVNVKDLSDGFEIEGAASVKGLSDWNTHDDHRLSMCGH